MARLVIRANGDERTVDLAPGEAVKIGRDDANDIALPDEGKASRRHCQVTGVKSGGTTKYELTDLGSTNKTRVNGKVVERKVLGHGDVIQVGVTEIHFEDEEEERQLQDAGAQGVCYLEWVGKERKGEKVWLRQPRVTFGRRESSTVVLDDRMASGHHAEIVRDLNGYTLRDLGSTNGTLVNGEPTSEVALTHGAKIRIGNSRFMFKDPSMKDIEVELSQFDDDDGWGMMGDIDLSRSRSGSLGLVLSLLLLAGAVAGAFFFMNKEKTSTDGGVTEANLLADGEFEEEDNFLWAPAGDDEHAQVRVQPGKGMTIRHGGEAGTHSLVRYTDEFDGVSTKPYHLLGQVRTSGDAEFLALWSNLRAGPGKTARGRSLTRSVSIPTEGGRVDAYLVKPPWADVLSLAVRAGEGGRATLRSLSMNLSEDEGAPQIIKIDAPGDPDAALNPTDGGVDLTQGLAPYFLGARPVARMSADGPILARFEPGSVEAVSGGARVEGVLIDDETSHPASVTWKRDGDDAIVADVRVEGARAVGVQYVFPERDLAGGLKLLTPQGPQTLSAEAGAAATGVRKILAGEGMRVVSFTAPEPQGDAEAALLGVSVAATPDAGLLAMHVLGAGSSSRVRCITDYGPSLEQAQVRLRKARGVLAERPGEGIRLCRALAQEFPFNDAVREEANRMANRRETELDQMFASARKAVRHHQIFGSSTTLTAAAAEVDALASLLATEPADTALGTRIKGLIDSLAEERRRHVARISNAGADNLGEMANLLRGSPGYEPMAAMYLRILVNRYGGEDLDPTLAARVEQARQELRALEQAHGKDLPPDPRTKDN